MFAAVRCAFALSLFLTCVSADLGTAVHRSAASRHAVKLPTSRPLNGTLVMQLQKRHAQFGKTPEATFYVGDLTVGFPPKTFSVIFDTASGHLLLPHRACKSPSCLDHHQYSPWESITSMDVDVNGSVVQQGHRLARGRVMRDSVTMSFTQADLGTGDVQTVVVRDHVCLSHNSVSRACIDMGVLAATNMTEFPFRYLPSDGIVGLGLSGLATSPFLSFFNRLLEGSANVVPQFGIALGDDHGELHLGGHDSARLSSPLQWFPVDHPEAGFWQVAIQAVRVGNKTVDDCRRGCHGIVDSAASRLGVQRSKLDLVRSTLTTSLKRDVGCVGPDLTFVLGAMSLTLEAKDYADSDCNPLLGGLDVEEPDFLGVYTFGATVLRRYYTAFDWQQRKVGFAPLASSSESKISQTLPDTLAGVLMV